MTGAAVYGAVGHAIAPIAPIITIRMPFTISIRDIGDTDTDTAIITMASGTAMVMATTVIIETRRCGEEHTRIIVLGSGEMKQIRNPPVVTGKFYGIDGRNSDEEVAGLQKRTVDDLRLNNKLIDVAVAA